MSNRYDDAKNDLWPCEVAVKGHGVYQRDKVKTMLLTIIRVVSRSFPLNNQIDLNYRSPGEDSVSTFGVPTCPGHG